MVLQAKMSYCLSTYSPTNSEEVVDIFFLADQTCWQWSDICLTKYPVNLLAYNG